MPSYTNLWLVRGKMNRIMVSLNTNNGTSFNFVNAVITKNYFLLFFFFLLCGSLIENNRWKKKKKFENVNLPRNFFFMRFRKILEKFCVLINSRMLDSQIENSDKTWGGLSKVKTLRLSPHSVFKMFSNAKFLDFYFNARLKLLGQMKPKKFLFTSWKVLK